MEDVWSIIVAVSTFMSAVFLFLGWYVIWKERRDKVLVTRFMEGNPFHWFIRVRPKRDNMLEDCTVSFARANLLTKAEQMDRKVIHVGSAENFMFWAADQPNKNDDREIIVKERGKAIYKRKFNKVPIEN